MARWCTVALLAVVTGCGLVRDVPVTTLVPGPADDATATRLPPSGLAHPRTLAWMHRFCARSSGRPAVALGISRGTTYLPRVEAILTKEGIPPELVAVPAVESRFRPDASGSHGERGIWQLRPATARRFGLQVSEERDDRLHLERATRAAARYLALLYERYGDWPLALAAYNAGEGRVDRALLRRPWATFWELAERGELPRLSRDYVPKVLAVVRLAATPGTCAAPASAPRRASVESS